MLISNYLKYFFFFIAASSSLICVSQNNSEGEGQSVLTIIGNPTNTNQAQEYTQEYQNTVNYQNQNNPPEKGVLSSEVKNISPTLENGFHMRFEIEQEQKSDSSSERLGSSGYASASTSAGGGGYGIKAPKTNTKAASRVYNIKKKLKKWFPKRKKKYRPSLCVDF